MLRWLGCIGIALVLFLAGHTLGYYRGAGTHVVDPVTTDEHAEAITRERALQADRDLCREELKKALEAQPEYKRNGFAR